MSKYVPPPEVAHFILNCIPSRDPGDDWGIEEARAAGVAAALPAAAIPPAMDLRATWWDVGDQGHTGSCVGWGTAEGVLRWHFVKAGRLPDNEPLSVRFVWMAAKETDAFTTRPTTFIECEGTSLKAALDISRKFGVVPDRVLRFENPPRTPELYVGDEKVFFALAAQRRIASYINLGKGLSDWRLWLATHGPILTRLEVDSTFDHATSTQGKLDTYDAQTARGGHCVALVGYDGERFIVRNSWGVKWGDKGFAYASEQYSTRAFSEAYGVTL